MTPKNTLLTQEGLEKLKKELNEYKTVKRTENEERLKEAISHGDLSENAEYISAKEEQARIEGKILELEQLIDSAEIIHNTKKKKTTVTLGATVTIEDLKPENEKERISTYTIVGTTETDPFNGKISNESPIGKAVMDKKPGTIVTAKTPSGNRQFKILKIK